MTAGLRRHPIWLGSRCKIRIARGLALFRDHHQFGAVRFLNGRRRYCSHSVCYGAAIDAVDAIVIALEFRVSVNHVPHPIGGRHKAHQTEVASHHRDVVVSGLRRLWKLYV